MPSRTVLHVGTMKSGTTHVQSRMFRNRQALLDHGVLVPGASYPEQFAAVRDGLATQREGRVPTGRWERLCEEMEAHDGTSLVSMELLGPIRSRLAEGIIGSLRAPEVVITVRDLNRCLAAMWQETIQNGRAWTWKEYLHAAEEMRPGRRVAGADVADAGRRFWRQQNVVRIARTWSALAPVTVVTVPPPSAPRSRLWDRICGLLGVPAAGWVEAAASNESIGAASAQALRRLNQLLDEAGRTSSFGAAVRKHFLAKSVLSSRRELEPAIGLPVPPWLERHSARMVEQLKGLDVTVVGCWADLRPADVPGVDPTHVADGEVLEAALAGLAALVERDAARTAAEHPG